MLLMLKTIKLTMTKYSSRRNIWKEKISNQHHAN